VRQLSFRERIIMEKRKTHSLRECATIFRVSVGRVVAIEKKAKEKLRCLKESRS
jgi:DNA-directed RNA polymerase sigma subunit (sigma70/sigma32)